MNAEKIQFLAVGGVALAEVAVGLSLIVANYRTRGSIEYELENSGDFFRHGRLVLAVTA